MYIIINFQDHDFKNFLRGRDEDELKVLSMYLEREYLRRQNRPCLSKDEDKLYF